MGTGYYEHSIEALFTEGLLNSSSDWQWFVDYTESNFEPSTSIATIDDFPKAYSSIQPAYTHLARIMDLGNDVQLSFDTPWLQKVYECVLIRTGIKQPEDGIKGDSFFDVLCVASFATYLINCVCETRYLYNSQLLYCSNLYQLFDFTPLGNDRQRYIELAEAVNVPGFEKAVETLKANLETKYVPIDEEYVGALLDTNFDVDFLSFKIVEGKTFQTWQEALLCDAFRVSFANGTVEPAIRLRNGSESPDTSAWTEDTLTLAKEAFVDKRAICIIEVLEFCKQGIAPSKNSQELIVNLFLEHAAICIANGRRMRSLSCTAFSVIEHLLEAKQLEEDLKSRYYRDLSSLLSEVAEYDDICFMKDHPLPCTKVQEEIFLVKTKSITKDSLASVSGAQDLIAFFKDSRSARNCDHDDAKLSFELLIKHAQRIDVVTAELFYWAMMFYIDVLNNPRVDNKWTKETLITLRRTWQENYYGAVVSSMQTIAHESTVPAAMIDELNSDFLENPSSFAQATFLRSDEAIADILESMAEHAIMYLFSRTTISEYYPEHVHVVIEEKPRSIDRMVASEIKRVYEEHSYRFLNVLEEQVMIDGFFERIGQGIQIMASFIKIEPAYEWLVENAPAQYKLLPFPGEQPTLGHLTQLFPVLENIIRYIGELFAIVPFQVEKGSYTRLRDVSSVLADLIGEIRDITGTIQGCNEFLFVYYVMYSTNGFNIRNECIHGRQYQHPAGVKVAFKLTAISTYMMLKRLRSLESIQLGEQKFVVDG